MPAGPSTPPTAPGLGPWRSGDAAGFVPFPDDAVAGSLGARFRDVASAHGQRSALSSPAGRWTYAELLAAVDARAAGLIDRLGGDSPVPVAVLADHDGPLVVTIMSVVAAGHIVVVLDPAAPGDQLRHAIAECTPPLLLHDDAHADTAAALAAGATGTVAVALDAVQATPRELPLRSSDDPVMLAFTSG